MTGKLKVSGFCWFFVIISFNPVLSQHFNVVMPADRDLNNAILYLSEFIASPYFDSLNRSLESAALVDTLYKRALDFYNQDHSEALLALLFVTLPYNKIPATIPILNSAIEIPLPSVNDSLFYLKRRNLPKKIFFDSPATEMGDKDKLPHFFGSAFLSYEVSIFNLSKFMGILIELFEETFKVEGYIDYRDLLADDLGTVFGDMLKNNNELMPSQVLIIYNLFFIRNIN